MNDTANPTSADRAHWAWRPVVATVLALVAWSVSTYLHDYVHVPWALAIGGAAIFDLSALILADLAHRATNTGDTAAALVYGTGVALFTTASAYVNWLHAGVAGWGIAGGILFAGAPIAAELLFVAQHWYQHRRKLRRDGKLSDSLPRLGLLSWMLFTRRSKRVIKAVVEARLDVIEARASGHVDAVRAELSGHAPGTPGQLPGAPADIALPGQTVRLQIETMPAPAPQSPGQLVPARVTMPAQLPEPVLAARAPEGHPDAPQPLSIAEAVRAAIARTGTNLDDITAHVAELKPDAREDSVRREARRQIAQMPPTGLYM